MAPTTHWGSEPGEIGEPSCSKPCNSCPIASHFFAHPLICEGLRIMAAGERCQCVLDQWPRTDVWFAEVGQKAQSESGPPHCSSLKSICFPDASAMRNCGKPSCCWHLPHCSITPTLMAKIITVTMTAWFTCRRHLSSPWEPPSLGRAPRWWCTWPLAHSTHCHSHTLVSSEWLTLPLLS